MPRTSDKLLVLDLDETLIYGTVFPLDREPDFRVGMAQALVRPFAQQFVATCLEWFIVGIWTSATREYADDVIAHLTDDPRRLAFVWAREKCVKKAVSPQPSTLDSQHPTRERIWIKNLGKLFELGCRPESIVVVDDSPESWEGHMENVVPVSKFKGDPNDRELDKVISFLEGLRYVPDVRSVARSVW